MATASVRQAIPVITNAAAPEVDTDEVSGILAILDTALDAYRKLRKHTDALGYGATICGQLVQLLADKLPSAEYAVTLWASANQLGVVRAVNDYGDKTMRVMRVHDGDPLLRTIVVVSWGFEPKVTTAAVMSALAKPHWTDDTTTSLDGDGREVVSTEVQR